MKDKTRTKAQLMTELQELRQRIAELDTTVDGVISIDAEMKIILWNAAAENMFGYTTEEMLGQSLMKIVPESFYTAKEKRFIKFQKTGSGPLMGKTLELEGKRKDGTLIPIELSVSSRKVGKKHIVTAIARDITQRKIEKDKLNQRTHELSERIKELKCFYELEKISRKEKITIEKLLKSAVRLLPPSWEYPDITGGCIAFDGKKYKTKNFKRTKWMQREDIVVDNKKAGCIEVCYLEEKPDMDEGPFLRDERRLIVAVTSRIGRIIERKQKEEALKESEERLRILFEYAPDSYYLSDLKGNFIDGNKAAEKLTGYKKEELIGKNFLKLKILDPQDSLKAASLLAKNLMGKSTGLDEFVLMRKDGTRVYVEISTNPVKVKGRTVVLGIARDISKIKQAENKLKLERAYIDQLFESAQEAIVMADKNGHVMRVNDEYVRLFGFSSPDELVGKLVDDLIVQDDAREIAKSITNKVGMGDSVSLETVRQKKDGSLIDVSVLASPIEVDGKLFGTFGIYRDITDRKQAEERLEQSLKEKEVLLREIHHRVKNNLQIISSLLLLQSNQISGKKNLELFQESQNRVKSMALIHEKLYQSQDLASINFREYLNSLVIGLFRSYQAQSDHVELKLEVGDISLGVDSAIPCGLIINELISNSLKYAFPNGREGVISVALRSLNKKDVELAVSDNGIGMPEDLDFRNSKSLGLRLVTILAEDQLEGEIKLSRDKGTEFRIKLRGIR